MYFEYALRFWQRFNSRTFPLIDATCEGDLDNVRQLIASNVDVNLQDELGSTALMSTAKGEQTGMDFYAKEPNLELWFLNP